MQSVLQMTDANTAVICTRLLLLHSSMHHNLRPPAPFRGHPWRSSILHPRGGCAPDCQGKSWCLSCVPCAHMKICV